MTVFISHAPADASEAEALEGLLERRGHFVERDDGEVALAPVAANDVVITLISSAFAADANKLRATQRALDAWSAGRLALVRLDETTPPIGLRDLPIIDAAEPDARQTAWAEVAAKLQKLGGPAPDTPAGKRRSVVDVLVTLALLAPGLFALAASTSIWLVNRIGPRPGGMAELLAGINSFGRFYHMPPGFTPVLFGLAMLLMLAVLVRLALPIARAAIKPRKPAGSGTGVYVSVAPADWVRVGNLVQHARMAGAPVALQPANADMAAAIEAANTVLVMCSPAAYESDQVKRDVFLAEHGGKRLVPVFLDAAPPPDDFAYFLGGQSGLALHGLSELEQARALAKSLGAANEAIVTPAPVAQE